MDAHNSEYGILQLDSRGINPSKVGIFGLYLKVRKERENEVGSRRFRDKSPFLKLRERL
jgi:hypothetical protein